MKISVSLLSEKKDLVNYVKKINELDVDYIHLDIMDNEFVPYDSFSYDEIRKIINTSAKPFDVHLMVKNIDEYIYNYAMLNTEYITIHYEALQDVKIIEKIKSYGIKCGISVKPTTNIELLYELLPKIDLVLIMSVEPGRGGQEFIKESLDKIKKISDKIKKEQLNVIISVDGGINKSVAASCKKAGADMIVVGTALSNATNKKEYIKECKASQI